VHIAAIGTNQLVAGVTEMPTTSLAATTEHCKAV